MWFPCFCREYCIALVTVAGRDGPVRNSVLPEHLADLPNFIELSSRWIFNSILVIAMFQGPPSCTRRPGAKEQSRTLVSHTDSLIYWTKNLLPFVSVQISILLVPLSNGYLIQDFMFCYRYYLKKRDTLATLIQDVVQQVSYKDYSLVCGMKELHCGFLFRKWLKRVKYINKYWN